MKRNGIDVKNQEKKKRKPSGAAVMKKEVTLALQRSLFIEWAKKGYVGISLEAVAKRAGVGKTSLYRRWPSKQEMVYSCLSDIAIDITASKDQGSLEEDIRAYYQSVAKLLKHSLIRKILSDLHALRTRSIEWDKIIKPFQEARREHGKVILNRAIKRKELAEDINIEICLDFIGATLYWRTIVLNKNIDSKYIEELLQLTMGALKN